MVLTHSCEVAMGHGQALQADGELDITGAHNVLDLEVLQMQQRTGTSAHSSSSTTSTCARGLACTAFLHQHSKRGLAVAFDDIAKNAASPPSCRSLNSKDCLTGTHLHLDIVKACALHNPAVLGPRVHVAAYVKAGVKAGNTHDRQQESCVSTDKVSWVSGPSHIQVLDPTAQHAFRHA
jgi:hypothetical protein